MLDTTIFAHSATSTIIPTTIASIASSASEKSQKLSPSSTATVHTMRSKIRESGCEKSIIDSKTIELFDANELLYTSETMARTNGSTISFATNHTTSATTAISTTIGSIRSDQIGIDDHTRSSDTVIINSRFTVTPVLETDPIEQEEILIGKLKRMKINSSDLSSLTATDDSESLSISNIHQKQLQQQERSLMKALKEDYDDQNNQGDERTFRNSSETSDSSCDCSGKILNETQTSISISKLLNSNQSNTVNSSSTTTSSNNNQTAEKIKVYRKHKPSMQYQEYKV